MAGETMEGIRPLRHEPGIRLEALKANRDILDSNRHSDSVANCSRSDGCALLGRGSGQAGMGAGPRCATHCAGLSRLELLGYKYLLGLEGNDVTSNLKWLMGHNVR